MTKHTNLAMWKEAASERGLKVHQVQGHEQFEARDGHTVVGHWNQIDGYLDDPVEVEPSPIVDPDGAPLAPSDPIVPETDVTKVES